MELILLEWVGAGFGIAGTLLLARKSVHARWAWPLYLVSNGCWIAFGYITGAYGMVVMNLVFTATSIIGIRHWFRPEPQVETA